MAWVSLIRRPRVCARLIAGVLVVVAGWLLLAPITAVYVVSNEASASAREPSSISTQYSWWTSDEVLVYSDTVLGQSPHAVKGIRVGCGNSFRSGAHVQFLRDFGGPQACSQVRSPRRSLGLVLLGLGLVGVLVARKLPVASTRHQRRYRQPYSQRRALRRAR